MPGRWLYAREIVPFFVFCSVVALRADLVLVTVASGGHQLDDGRERYKRVDLKGNLTNLLLIDPYFVAWSGR